MRFLTYLLLLITTSLFTFSANAEEGTLHEWIVLKNKTQGYSDIDYTTKIENPFFYEDEKVYGELIKDTLKPIRKWAIKVKEGDKIIYFPFAILVQNIDKELERNLKIGTETVDIETPLPIGYKANDMEKLEQKWNYHKKDYPKYLRKETHQALLKMLSKAASEGVHLLVVSAFRDYSKQKQLYLRAIKNNGIEQVGTAKPGHSEHQLGTTVDLTSVNREDLLSYSFDETPEGQWLQKHAHEFGFYQTYTKDDTKGYMPEPWHYRYLKPN